MIYSTVFRQNISIHALRVEGDVLLRQYLFTGSDFYPRPPGGGRPAVALDTTLTHEGISIHALRVEGDNHRLADLEDIERFLSTPSGWRATPDFEPPFPHIHISIHALRVEGDPLGIVTRLAQASFLSTPSGWRATAKTDKVFICFCAKGRRICLFKTREEKICRWRFKKDKFWVLIWCEGSGKSVCASASHCG